jgi:hypothetical protein
MAAAAAVAGIIHVQHRHGGQYGVRVYRKMMSRYRGHGRYKEIAGNFQNGGQAGGHGDTPQRQPQRHLERGGNRFETGSSCVSAVRAVMCAVVVYAPPCTAPEAMLPYKPCKGLASLLKKKM